MLKRTPLTRKTPLKGKNAPKANKSRKGLRMRGVSDSSVLKEQIQALLRDIVILRDGGCILRWVRHCGGEIGEAVLQADHLITRSNSATFADHRLVVCVCRRCHGWKSLGSNLRKAQYDELVKSIIAQERVKLWEKCEKESWASHRKGSYDWEIHIIELKQYLEKLKQ